MPGFFYRGDVGYGPDGKLQKYDVAAAHATRLAIGDCVTLTGVGTAVTGVEQVDASTATQAITGVISGIVPNFLTENLTDTGLAASTLGSVLVQIAPRAEYEVDVTNGPLVLADVGLNIDIIATAATNTAGYTQSNMTINASTKATTVTLPFRIIRLMPDAAGVLGNRAMVRVNNSTTISGATGV